MALLGIAFGPAIADLVGSWVQRPEYSHGFLMPPIAAWVLWERRAQLASLAPRPSIVGIVIMAVALAALLVGEMGLFRWIRAPALVGALGALLWSLYGWSAVRIALPALVVLLLMCPLPGSAELALTLPLKRTAALFATGMLSITGIDAALEGNLIHLRGVETLWVADACSGIRSLISLFSLAVLACLFWQKHWGLKLAVIVSCVPIALLVNGLRIWLTGYLAHTVGMEAATGFFHHFEGVLLFLVAALLLAGWALLLSRVFSRDADGGTTA